MGVEAGFLETLRLLCEGLAAFWPPSTSEGSGGSESASANIPSAVIMAIYEVTGDEATCSPCPSDALDASSIVMCS